MWTDGSGKSAKRFSLLLLQENESYIHDWIATCTPSSRSGSFPMRSWQSFSHKGLLRLCSKSIFFEPERIGVPILMFPLNKVSKIELAGKNDKGFVIYTSMLVRMKVNGIDAPYEFDKSQGTWLVTLDYSPVQQFLQQAQALLSVNSLPPHERDMVLRNTAAQKEAQAQFDISRLADLNEEILFNYSAAQLTPLIREPGRLVLTKIRLYFQPLHNLNDDSPVRSQPLDAVIAIAKRRYSLQQIGLEIFYKESNVLTRVAAGEGLLDGTSAFFTFRSSAERDDAVTNLLHQLQGETGLLSAVGSLLDKNESWLDRTTAAWQAGHISNYDYLMYLNLVSGRSRCDLTQWPVMPWILKDYQSQTLNFNSSESFRDLSKPVGALNDTRLAVFQERYRQMSVVGDNANPPFLYGTHYSTPGYVLYWLVRTAPAHMLRLQNGRFDSPDRLFLSVLSSWQSVLNNNADVKELIPEFYALPSNFLVARDDLDLGVRQNGCRVGDVVLPPWAKDPDDFILKHRKALECTHTSLNLHNWIDLMFGYKQQGQEALNANNLFHHLTYEGGVDLEKIEDPFERMSLESQINEFGQAPLQLFSGPHPPQLITGSDSVEKYVEMDKGSCAQVLLRVMTNTVYCEDLQRQTIEYEEAEIAEESIAHKASTSSAVQEDIDTLPLVPACEFGLQNEDNSSLLLRKFCELQPWRGHREPVNALLISDDNASHSLTLYCASKDGLIKVYSITEGFQIRATKVGNLPLCSLALAGSGDAYPIVLAGSYDSCVHAYSVDYGRSLGKIRVHDDTVSSVRVTCDQRMVTASWDSTVKVWCLDEGRGGWGNAFGGGGGSTATFAAPEMEVTEHEAAVMCLDIDGSGHIVASGAEDGCVCLWDRRTSTVPIWTANESNGWGSDLRISSDATKILVASNCGHLYVLDARKSGSVVSKKKCGSPLRCCEILGNVAIGGSVDGVIHLWNWNEEEVENDSITQIHDHSSCITSIAVSSAHVATASQDCYVHLYGIDQTML